jgi:hypothetical protein
MALFTIYTKCSSFNYAFYILYKASTHSELGTEVHPNKLLLSSFPDPTIGRGQNYQVGSQ